MTRLAKLRLRLIIFVIGIPLATFGAISLGPSWLALPLVGAAAYALTLTLGRVAGRASQPFCWTCGGDMSAEPVGDHGAVCPSCGTLNTHLAKIDVDSAAAEDEAFRSA